MATCREIITSNDYQDFIIETNEDTLNAAQQDPEACVKLVDDTWSVGYGKLPANNTLSVGSIGYYTIPKLYGLMDTTSFDSSGITTTLNQPSLNVRGQGVLIGFIDTGIDYLLDSFKFAPTSTKILTIWDQSLELQQNTISSPSESTGNGSTTGNITVTPGSTTGNGTTAPGSTTGNGTTAPGSTTGNGTTEPGSTTGNGTTEPSPTTENITVTPSPTTGNVTVTPGATSENTTTGQQTEVQPSLENLDLLLPGEVPNTDVGQRTIESIKEALKREFDYGTIYTEADINRALQANQNNDNPYAIVASSDTLGHGTFLARVASASQTDTYIGAAPDARIAMVKLKPAKQYLRDFYLIKEGADAYQESDIMLGIRYLDTVAKNLNLPLVICLGVGTSSSSRTGSSPLDSVLSTFAKQGNNVAVTCMGNEANTRGHVTGNVSSSTEPQEIEISVGSNERGFSMEIWADSLDVLSVSIVSPSGELIPRIPARIGPSSEYKFLLENTQVTVDYKIAEKTTGYEVVFMRFITPSEGIWKVNIYSLTNIKGGFNAWLPIKEFLSGDTYFLNSTPNGTLTGPADAVRPITIGAYDHISGGIYIDSGRGNTPDNRVKPDIVAPGVNIYGPRAGGGFTYRSGTSIAAAHVAGAAALLLTWGVYYQNSPLMGTSEIKSVLIRGADREEQMTYPNNIWGYGKLNLIKSFLQMRIT